MRLLAVLEAGVLETRDVELVLTQAAAGGLSANVSSLTSSHRTSMRKPSMPRSSQKRMTSYIGLADLGVAPVEVRLLAVEEVQVVLAGRLVELPRRAAEEARPVVGQASRPGPASRQMYQSRLGLSREARDSTNHGCSSERVVGDEVEDDPQAAAVGLADQRVEVVERPEQRVDVAVVGDVVAEVRHRRAEDRRQPDRVDAQRRDVVEAAAMPGRSPTPSPSASAKERG